MVTRQNHSHGLLNLTLFLTLVLYVSARPQKRSIEDDWGKLNKCPVDSFVTGFSLKLKIESDISTITSIRFYCTRQHVLSERKDAYIETIIQPDTDSTPDSSSSSHWVNPVFCERGVATDFKVKYAELTPGHRTVTNLKLICSDGETLKIHGHKKDKGDWSQGSQCSPRHAICGLQTQAQELSSTSTGNVLTDARVHCCDVKNPATKCTPSDRWQLVVECENNEAILPKTCVYDKKVGTSYAGKEKETSVYENLGFTLNGVSTDLSGKIEFMEGVTSIETGYKWDTASHDTWIPETKTEDKVTVQPGQKSAVYQVVGHCGFYRIRASQFKVESGSANPPPAPIAVADVKPHAKKNHDHHGKNHQHQSKHEHDPNIQADFGGDDDDWGDDWSDEEQVDETGKHEEVEHKPKEEHKEDPKKKESEESFEDWDESEEKAQPEPVKTPIVEDSKPKHEEILEKKEHHEKKESAEQDSFEDWGDSEEKVHEPATVDIPLKKQEEISKKEDKKAASEESFEDWDESEEKKHEIKSNDKPVVPHSEEKLKEKHHSAEKKDTDNGSFEDWDESEEEEKKSETKIEDHIPVEEKPKSEVHEVPVPVAPTSETKPDEKHEILEDKKESIESFSDWDHSEEKKPEEIKPVAPTLDTKVEEKTVKEIHHEHNHHAGVGKKEESQESFEDWDESEEKKPETISHAQEAPKTEVKHEPPSKADLQESDAMFNSDWDASKEKTHEAMVVHADQHKDKKPAHDDDMELMAKDKASEEWDFSDEDEEESHEKPEAKKPEPEAQHVHQGHHGHSHGHSHQNAPHAEMHIHSEHPDGTHMESKQEAPKIPDAFDQDWDDWDMELPETKFDKMEKQVEPQPKPEPSSDADTDDLKFPDSFKGTLEQVDQAAKDAAQAAEDAARAFHEKNLAPLAEQISTGIKDAEEALKDFKDSPGVKEVEKALSEVMDAALNPPNHDAPVHPDDEPVENKIHEEDTAAASTQESTGSPKVQSAVLGYIVGGMVAGVVIIVIIIFVLERRQPKRYDAVDEAEKNGEGGGGVRDPPLLSGYKKDAPLATTTNDKDAF